METICRAMSIKSFMSRVSRLGKTLAILSLKGIKERAARMALCKAVPLIDLFAAVMAGSSGLLIVHLLSFQMHTVKSHP